MLASVASAAAPSMEGISSAAITATLARDVRRHPQARRSKKISRMAPGYRPQP